MNDFFDLVRPIIEFQFEVVLARSNNIFEVMTNEPIDVLLKVQENHIHYSYTSKNIYEQQKFLSNQNSKTAA